MANPFLILGGVAVGVITAGIGVLSVPGWIDAANDSAAINDLGNIRGAESAAILHLGEYTDDFGVLRSGELGVKFQKSEGVTLIGLKADGNESWCAAVQSKTGKFFAASDETARIATGPGAESAMTTAGCTPAIIAEIIAEAGTRTPPIGVGTPGTGGGTWVGGDGAEAGGGGTDPVGGGSVEPAPYGATTTMQSVRYVAATSHGVYSIDDSGKLVRSGAGVAPYEVTLGGIGADILGKYRDWGIAVDAQENLYFAGVFWTEATGPKWQIFKVTPDHVATAVKDLPEYASDVLVGSSPRGEVYYWFANDVWKLGSDGEFARFGTYNASRLTNLTADDSGSVYFYNGSVNRFLKMDGSGPANPVEITVGGLALHSYGPGGGVIPAPNGTVYAAVGYDVGTIDSAGAYTSIASPLTAVGVADTSRWNNLQLSYIDESSNLYVTSWNVDGGAQLVIKVTPAGESSVVVGNG